jgi:tRNA-splicing ligase RtcB
MLGLGVMGMSGARLDHFAHAPGDPARIGPCEAVEIAGAAPDAPGIVIRSRSARGIAEEAPGAYKDIGAVVGARAPGRRLKPLISIKG